MNAADALNALMWEDRDVDVMHFEFAHGGSLAVSASALNSDVAIGVWITDSGGGLHADIRAVTAGGEPIPLQVAVLDADVSITAPKVDTP